MLENLSPELRGVLSAVALIAIRELFQIFVNNTSRKLNKADEEREKTVEQLRQDFYRLQLNLTKVETEMQVKVHSINNELQRLALSVEKLGSEVKDDMAKLRETVLKVWQTRDRSEK